MRAVTTWVARSSGRMSTSDPLLARPMGLRVAATIDGFGHQRFLRSD